MDGPFPLIGFLALIVGALAAWGYGRTKRPLFAILAGVLLLFAALVFWRASIPPGQRPAWLR